MFKDEMYPVYFVCEQDPYGFKVDFKWPDDLDYQAFIEAEKAFRYYQERLGEIYNKGSNDGTR